MIILYLNFFRNESDEKISLVVIVPASTRNDPLLNSLATLLHSHSTYHHDTFALHVPYW